MRFYKRKKEVETGEVVSVSQKELNKIIKNAHEMIYDGPTGVTEVFNKGKLVGRYSPDE
ncbi:MAG: hypothetical protein V1818_02615 [Candidatus Aenigmatarchaeota archaeon]